MPNLILDKYAEKLTRPTRELQDILDSQNAQQRVQWTARLVAQVKSLLSSLWSAVLRRH